MAQVVKADKMNKCIGCFTCMLICSTVNRKNHSFNKSGIHVRTSGGLSGRFVASICHACRDPACVEACQSNALTLRRGGGVRLEPTNCIGCRRCETVCMVRAISFDDELRKPIICTHCALCARYCPHKCLTVHESPDFWTYDDL